MKDERVIPTITGPQRGMDFPEAEVPTAHIIVYICPATWEEEGVEFHCPNYYAAPGFDPDNASLEVMQSMRDQRGERVESHARLECPACRARGVKIQRKAWIVTQVVDYEAVRKKLK